MMNRAPARVKGDRAHVAGSTPQNRIPFQFVGVPSHLLRAGNLSFGAVILFGVIADAARQSRSGACRLANATLGERIGRSESEVGRYILELESAGLVVRDFAGQSKYVRLGVRPTWIEPVPDVQGTPSVQVPEDRQPVPGSSGMGVPDVPGPIQSVFQNERSETIFLPLGEENPEEAVPDGATAAAYLRAMIAKGKAEATQTKPAVSPALDPSPNVAEVPPARSPEPSRSVQPTPPAGPSRATQDDARPVVAGMLASLFKDARKAAWGPVPGKPRHPSQAEQLAALDERKRRREREARNGPGASNRPPNAPNV